ncbi:MAG: hypothetical protein ACT4SY_02135 [Hyphomicrobiales bacterium]
MLKKLHPLHRQIFYRGMRSFYLRKLDRHSNEPKFQGQIICHILDLRSGISLLPQLDYLIERDVKTFRIYSTRKEQMERILHSYDRFRGLSTLVIGVPDGMRESALWRLVDNFNFALPRDKWSLILRAGEFLLYPHFETRTISDLCQFLFDEHRRSLFAILLDLYRRDDDDSEPGLVFGSGGWRFDRYGYDFAFNELIQADLWHGGFLYRFPIDYRRFGREHISRVPLVRAGFRTLATKDLVFALPRRLNWANGSAHLSPTACIVSDRAYRFWQSHGLASADGSRRDKLVSAPSLPMRWRHRDLITNGFMNAGQWY